MFKTEGSILYYFPDNFVKGNKIGGFDLDHTLIKPKTGRVHPKTFDDWELCFPNIIDKFQELLKQDYTLVIFSNQMDLLKKQDKYEMFTQKIKLVNDFFQKLYINLTFICSTESDHCRKPNIGMYQFLQTKMEINKKESFYVGDAAGRIKEGKLKKDFSCSDRMFAKNCNIRFYTEKEYFLGIDNRKFIMENSSKLLFPKIDYSLEKDKILSYNIIMLIGSPASGKSKFSQSIGYEIINQDSHSKSKYKTLKFLKVRIQEGQKKFIFDNTNNKIGNRKEYLDIIKTYFPEEKVLCIEMDITKKQCMFLNNFRCKKEKGKKLSDIVIHSYFKYYEEPKLEEGFSEIMKIPFILDTSIDIELFSQYY